MIIRDKLIFWEQELDHDLSVLYVLYKPIEFLGDTYTFKDIQRHRCWEIVYWYQLLLLGIFFKSLYIPSLIDCIITTNGFVFIIEEWWNIPDTVRHYDGILEVDV